ncbi:uncharacterized protein LOC126808899 [Patella vulgata]|uniref:uncharacterized protein LOC126808899 n=1 Tax=Patella vulgata TaxID=6465 RepID=UPI002180383D|nr:uncharacterized protein LOC126808899 [Patella vulgata]XP_050389913.1 uncharacterized protein LOC126808899 [Patella vulgata]XP_050389914.1 uncharacterized protein LOC126808899 [Patella vulgata]
MIEAGELSTYLHRIDALTTEDYDQIKDITKKHWKSNDTRKCFTRSCRKPFSLIERSHHCRRCGEVFCFNCVKYQRKLNKLANPDPDGKSYKVCFCCYEEGKVTEGVQRSWLSDFKQFRVAGQNNRWALANGQQTRSRRSRLNLDTECQRLIQGFKNNITRSEVKRTLQEMRSMVAKPDWQKSSIWIQENMSSKCATCSSDFNLLRSKYSCTVCGVVVCKSCSSKDLLVFIPDEDEYAEPELVIIKIVGCPAVEPEVSLQLRVCGTCRDLLETKQVARYQQTEITTTDNDFLSKLLILHEKFHGVEEKINVHLPEYELIVSSLNNNSRGGGGQNGKSNMKTLAKAQEDLADYLTEHVTSTQQLKRLKPETNTQSNMFKCYIKSKCDYYMENMSRFRRLGKQLSQTSPPEVLEFIQRIMNKDSIISGHVYIRQLIYETINLCGKYHLDELLPKLLMVAEERIEKDVSLCLRLDGEDYDQHEDLVQEMIKSQMKHHKLIRTSRTMEKKQGAVHVKSIMLLRCVEVLKQMLLQLQLKTTNKSFSETKASINNAIEKIESIPCR